MRGYKKVQRSAQEFENKGDSGWDRGTRGSRPWGRKVHESVWQPTFFWGGGSPAIRSRRQIHKRKRLAKCLTRRSYRGAVLEYNFSLFAAEMLVGGPASIPQTIRVSYLRGFVFCERGLFFVSHPSEPLPPPSSPSWASVSVRESRACSDLASVTSHVFSSRSTVNFRLSLL